MSFTMAAMLAVCVFMFPAMAEGTDGFTFALSADGQGYILTAYTGQEETVTVPDWHNSLPVVAIGEGAFQGNAALKAVKLPSSVTVIGKAAFKNCTSLRSVTSYQAAAEPPAPARVPGDVNEDGKVNSRDALAVIKYAAGQSVSINTANADVNADGNVNSRDALAIIKYAAGQDVTLK